MSVDFPIPLHLMYCRHRLPGDMRPRHADVIAWLTAEQVKQWEASEDAHDFACSVLDPDLEKPLMTNLGADAVELLEAAFDGWWLGHPDCIFDVGVYSLR